MILRKFSINDAEELLRWRNDCETRRRSFNIQPITLKEHQRFISESINSTKRTIYIGMLMGKSIGQIRFDRIGTTAEIDITIAPEERGKGYGQELLKLGIREYSNEYKDTLFLARIKYENKASINIFEANGFVRIAEYHDFGLWGILYDQR